LIGAILQAVLLVEYFLLGIFSSVKLDEEQPIARQLSMHNTTGAISLEE
jgi:hypothetical protein